MTMRRTFSAQANLPPVESLSGLSVSSTSALGSNSIDVLIPERYVPIPTRYKLQKLVIVHRHGDRAQIAKSLGNNYAINAEVTARWYDLMPSSKTLEVLRNVANTADEHNARRPLPFVQGSTNSDSTIIDDRTALYTGWDRSNYPYAQLTEVGAQQLIEVGQRLRRHYLPHHPHILPASLSEAADSLYCRTTNFCRTHQSTRGLLAGLLQDDPFDVINNKQNNNEGSKTMKRPIVTTRPRPQETLYPQADANCVAMLRRRAEILSEAILTQKIPEYPRLKTLMQETFAFPDHKVNWLHIKEVVHCHEVHASLGENPLVPHVWLKNKRVTRRDLELSGHVATMTWSILYNDDILNRMAIGRFLHEFLEDITGQKTSRAQGMGSDDHTKRVLVYSGHDSTLVPLLCAMKCYDGKTILLVVLLYLFTVFPITLQSTRMYVDRWPEYASHIVFEIALDTETQCQVIRVIYNDKTVHPWSQQEPAKDHARSSPEDWMDFDVFVQRLSQLALSPEEYTQCCNSSSSSSSTTVPQAAQGNVTGNAAQEELLKQTQEDIEREMKATTSGSD